MTREHLGWLIWIGVGALVLIPELLALGDRRWLWPTLPRTAANLEARVPWIAMLLLAGFVALAVHLVFWPWPDVP